MNNEWNETKAYWIWYPGDWEIWLHEQISIKRQWREVMYPPFWRLDRHYSSVIYTYTYHLTQPEEITITADGRFAAYLDGKDNQRSNTAKMVLPEGKHELSITVYNDVNPPALHIEGDHIHTNNNWQVSCFDKKWSPVGSWKEQLNSSNLTPSHYKLATEEHQPASVERTEDGWMADFGKETFGYLKVNGIDGKSSLTVYYGESMEEVEDRENCVLLDNVFLDGESKYYTFPASRAFRYAQIVPESENFQIDSISMLYEYLPVEYRSSFRSSNDLLNDIWETSIYTFHLNTREFFFDGIKRDRWVWSGDSYQSFLMNYYSFFDHDVVKRTLIALRGKEPIVTHINTILDYSLYWFTGIYDYYLHTGDVKFVKSQYDSMVSLMDFCLGRRNTEGMMEGIEEDWVFIDWADIDKRGEVSTIQILLCRSLETMALVAELVGDKASIQSYRNQASELKEKVMHIFWDENKGGLVHNRYNGVLSDEVTKYPNMFALLFGYFNERQIDRVKQNVMLNSEVQAIKTPYMRFFELAALCEVGEHQYVLDEMLSYWGGMLALGATSFWEEYDPNQSGRQHLEMYDMPYGKSLCHAWGASPIYLIGKYFLGVTPASPGYENFVIEPQLGGLDWFEGTVPIGIGDAEVYMDNEKICVRASHGKGVLKYKLNEESHETPIPIDGSWLKIPLS